MMAARPIVLVCFALLWAAPDVEAQRVVVSYSPTLGAPGITQSIGLGTGGGDWSEPHVVNGVPVLTSDGRYLLYRRPLTSTGPLLLVLRDMLTGSMLPLPFDFEPRLAHPSAVRVFGLANVQSTGFLTSAGSFARLDGSGMHVGGGCPAGTTVEFDLTVTGETAAALCQSGDVVVFNVDSGLTGYTLSADPAAPVSSVRVTHDGTRLLVTRKVGPDNQIAAIDIASGATIVTNTMGPANAGCGIAGIAPDKTMVVMRCSWFVMPISVAGDARVIDVATLTLGPSLTGQIPGRAVFSPDNREVFLSANHRLGFGTLNRYDAATGAVTLSSGVIFPGPFAVAFAPLAPTLSHTITGARVDLTWSLPQASPAVTAYTVQVGSTPGATDLRFPVGTATSLSVPTAPAGRYYVRVVAENVVGAGEASNEIVVEVP